MPNLVVYVPTSLWEEIKNLGLDNPKVEARKVARGALEDWLKSSETQDVSIRSGAASAPTESADSRAQATSSRVTAPDSHFKGPDFK